MKRPFVYCFLATAIFLSGCASYNALSLNSPTSDIILSSEDMKKDEIFVIAKKFNKADCMRYLDRDVIKEGYQPIQLYIQNDSEKSYLFELNRISLSLARPEEVAEKVHTSTVGRAVGYGAGALILWPLAIPAIIDGVKSAQANDALDTDFSSKAAQNHTIQPHSYFNKLIFVPNNEYLSKFTVTLIDIEARKTKVLKISL